MVGRRRLSPRRGDQVREALRAGWALTSRDPGPRSGYPYRPQFTSRQGQRHFTGLIHAATDSVQDAYAQLLGIDFVGTDHVFRLNRTRVEAFSGATKDLYHHLENGQLERYRTAVHAQRKTWPLLGWDSKWDGPVSTHRDGSVLAMRVLT
ncbi:hypothetical protein ACIPUC_17720 [Streptomyces sp. LARHCF249]